MENQKIIEQIVHGMDYYLDTLAIPSHMTKYSDEMCSWIRPLKYPGPAGVYRINFNNKNDDEIKRLIQLNSEKGAPGYWFVTPLSVPRHLGDIVKGMGMTVNDDHGMAIPPEKINDAGWTKLKRNSIAPVKKIKTKEEFNIWADIVNKALFNEFMVDPDFYYPLCESGRMICFLGYSGDIPVATSMTLMTDNKTGRLEWISTLPEYRKRGFGTALCCAGIEQLISDGASVITLTARTMGVSLYRSLGFIIFY